MMMMQGERELNKYVCVSCMHTHTQSALNYSPVQSRFLLFLCHWGSVANMWHFLRPGRRRYIQKPGWSRPFLEKQEQRSVTSSVWELNPVEGGNCNLGQLWVCLVLISNIMVIQNRIFWVQIWAAEAKLWNDISIWIFDAAEEKLASVCHMSHL